MPINYLPPILKNFLEEQRPSGILPLSELDEWTNKHKGKFVLAALGDAITLYAWGNAYKHSQVLNECAGRDDYDIILGGGEIGVDDDKKRFSVYGRSLEFGGLPNKVLKEYFLHFGCGVETDTLEIFEDSTRKWFRDHGRDI